MEDGAMDAGLTDEALLAGMAWGDESAAVVFVRRYQRRVFGLARSILGDAMVAEDVAQEALLRAWRHAAVFDSRRGSAATWVLRITRNLAIDALRLGRAVPTDPDDFAAMGLVSTEGVPEDVAVGGDAVPALRAALQRLPAEQRRALVLAAVHGRTAAEISASEQIPLGTAKTRIRAGLSKLRAGLAGAEAGGTGGPAGAAGPAGVPSPVVAPGLAEAPSPPAPRNPREVER